MASARIYQWAGDEQFPATNAAGGGTWTTEASGAAAPTNGQQLRRRFLPYDPTTDEGAFFIYTLPSNYSSGGTLSFRWSSNATSGNVIWKTAYALETVGTTDFDGVAFGTVTAAAASAANATAGVATSVSIDLGVTGATAGQVLYIYLGRDADNASDTVNANDAEFLEPWLLTFNVV